MITELFLRGRLRHDLSDEERTALDSAVERTVDFEPRATIIRWFTSGDNGEDKGQVLVVTQLKTGATCQIALIDALAVKSANEKARQIADAKAGSFDCAKEPEIIQPFRAF